MASSEDASLPRHVQLIRTIRAKLDDEGEKLFLELLGSLEDLKAQGGHRSHRKTRLRQWNVEMNVDRVLKAWAQKKQPADLRLLLERVEQFFGRGARPEPFSFLEGPPLGEEEKARCLIYAGYRLEYDRKAVYAVMRESNCYRPKETTRYRRWWREYEARGPMPTLHFAALNGELAREWVFVTQAKGKPE